MTSNYLDSFKTILGNHSWGSLTKPLAIYFGPIPPVLTYPVIGLIATSGDVDDETLESFEMDEVMEVTVLLPITVNDSAASYKSLLGYRDQIRELIYDNPDLGYPVTGSSGVEFVSYQGWESEYLAQENSMHLLQALTVKVAVKYKQAIT